MKYISLFKFACVSFLLALFLWLVFLYETKNQGQPSEATLITLTQKIKHLDLHLNQRALLFHLKINSNKDEVLNALDILEKHSHLLKKYLLQIPSLSTPAMQYSVSQLYSPAYKKTVLQFLSDSYFYANYLSDFQESSEKIMRNSKINPTTKFKVFQLHTLLIQPFVTLENPASFNTLQALTPLIAPQATPSFIALQEWQQQAQRVVFYKKNYYVSLQTLLNSQNLMPLETLEKRINEYFVEQYQKEAQLQILLITLVIFCMVYIGYLIHHLRKRNSKINHLLADMEKQQIALNQHAIVSIANAKGLITYVNQKFCDVSGFSKEELLGKNHRIIKSGFHSSDIFKEMWQTITQGRVWHGELKNKTKQKGYYWVNGTIVPFLNEQGQIYQYISIRTDITRQKELEKQILEKQYFLEQITQTMAQGVYAIDVQGLCTFWNKEAENILGWTFAELKGKELHEFLQCRNPQGLRLTKEECLMNQSISHNQLYHSETELFEHKQQRILPISITVVPLLEEQNVIGAVAVFQDITQRKADEQLIRQAISHAQQANQAKGDFLANISHEIRTPMNGIIGMLDLLLTTPLNIEQMEYLELVKEATQALLTMVNDLLDFSKMEAGKITLDETLFELPQLLKKTLAILISKAEQKKLLLQLDLCAEPLPILKGDAAKLRQILLNLIGNAIKFTFQGSIVVKVTLKEKTAQYCSLLFTITDTGIGILPEKQAQIFEAFSQADNSVTRRFGGTGLGLAISKQFVELMGGELQVISQVNQGSIFSFTIKFAYKEETDLTATENSLPETHLLQIVVVEDQAVIQETCLQLLKNLGLSIMSVHTEKEIIGLFEQHKLDLILIDCEILQLNSLMLCKKIRQLEQHSETRIPIIGVTVDLQTENQQVYLAAGMDACLAKPMTSQLILSQIARFFPEKLPQLMLLKNQQTSPIILCQWDKALARLGGEETILKEFIRLYLAEQSHYWENIKQALQTQDIPQLQQELQVLRDIFATVGAEPLERLLKQLENSIAQQSSETIALALMEIEPLLLELNTFLQLKIAE